MPTFKLIGTAPMKISNPYMFDGRVGIPIQCLLGGIREVIGEPLRSRVTLHSTQFTLDECQRGQNLVTAPVGWECMVRADVSLDVLRQVGAGGIGTGRPVCGTFEVIEVSE